MSDKTIMENKKQKLIEMTKEFCGKFLDEEYSKLCEKLIIKMTRKRNVPFIYGEIEIWAAAVIYALGQINFLFDKSFTPYSTPDDICNYFRTSKSTTSQKAKLIRDMFKMGYYDKEFTVPSIAKDNPLNDYAMVDGFILPKTMM